jgi:hypothetical protein
MTFILAALRWSTLLVFLGWFLVYFYWRGGAEAARSLLASLRERNDPDAAAMTVIGLIGDVPLLDHADALFPQSGFGSGKGVVIQSAP